MTAPERGATYQIALASTGSSTHNALYLPFPRSCPRKRLSGNPASDPHASCFVVPAQAGSQRFSVACPGPPLSRRESGGDEKEDGTSVWVAPLARRLGPARQKDLLRAVGEPNAPRS